jgi:hypothetical protein
MREIGWIGRSKERDEQRYKSEIVKECKSAKSGLVNLMRACRDPSTSLPDAPKGGAQEKIGPLRSG